MGINKKWVLLIVTLLLVVGVIGIPLFYEEGESVNIDSPISSPSQISNIEKGEIKRGNYIYETFFSETGNESEEDDENNPKFAIKYQGVDFFNLTHGGVMVVNAESEFIGNITTNFNISADYFIGNGTLLTSLNCSQIIGGGDGDYCEDDDGGITDITNLTWNDDWMIAYSDGDGLQQLTFNNDDGKFLMSNGEGALTFETITEDNVTWNETYADTLYVNIEGDNMTGNLGMGNNSIVNVSMITFTNDTVNHRIYDNETCITITGDTSSLIIC